MNVPLGTDTKTKGPRGSVEVVGTMAIDAPLATVLEVCMDHSRKMEFEGGLELAEEVAGSKKGTVKSLSGYPAEWVEYKVYHIAPGMSKRDYVFKGTLVAGKIPGKSTPQQNSMVCAA